MARTRKRIFFAEPREHAALVELFTARERERVFGHLPRPLTRAELERSIRPQLAPAARRRRILRILESEAADRRLFCDVTDLCWACKWLPRSGGSRRQPVDFCQSCMARLRATAGTDALRERYAEFARTLAARKQTPSHIAAHLGLPRDVLRRLMVSP